MPSPLDRGNASLAVPIIGVYPALVALGFLGERLTAVRSSASPSRSRLSS